MHDVGVADDDLGDFRLDAAIRLAELLGTLRHRNCGCHDSSMYMTPRLARDLAVPVDERKRSIVSSSVLLLLGRSKLAKHFGQLCFLTVLGHVEGSVLRPQVGISTRRACIDSVF